MQIVVHQCNPWLPDGRWGFLTPIIWSKIPSSLREALHGHQKFSRPVLVQDPSGSISGFFFHQPVARMLTQSVSKGRKALLDKAVKGFEKNCHFLLSMLSLGGKSAITFRQIKVVYFDFGQTISNIINRNPDDCLRCFALEPFGPVLVVSRKWHSAIDLVSRTGQAGHQDSILISRWMASQMKSHAVAQSHCKLHSQAQQTPASVLAPGPTTWTGNLNGKPCRAVDVFHPDIRAYITQTGGARMKYGQRWGLGAMRTEIRYKNGGCHKDLSEWQ